MKGEGDITTRGGDNKGGEKTRGGSGDIDGLFKELGLGG